jgi:hypothetical protein
MIVLFNPRQRVGALLEQKDNHPVPAAKYEFAARP